MLSGEKILVTGPAGQIAFPLTEYLARDNEVWGIARFGNPEERKRVDALGVTTRRVDLAAGEFGDLPDDFTYVLHLAAYIAVGDDYDEALRVNAEGTGLLLRHCRKAKAALVMSTASVLKPHEDPHHVYGEDAALGDAHNFAATYSFSKIAGEAVARYCARAFDLPVTIARMNASYGSYGNGGLPGLHLAALRAGGPVVTRWDPCMYSPIHQDDINMQTEALLAAASTPATIVNWGGDEPVSVQEWAAYMGELTGLDAVVDVKPQPGTLRGQVLDTTRRRSFTGPCAVDWRTGIRRVVEDTA
ncbi:NAD-dependent epimerase/dehydratase family protein [Uniformispora flossi]|uniref:NAD-dependent epimerase/dehydratase family protein n=1 Tax=Uniformispora flossi TaxID=3390723 RepID=UPI003C2B209B